MEALRPYCPSFLDAHYPRSKSWLQDFFCQGEVLILENDDDVGAALALLSKVDGQAHLEQLSVHQDHARRGYGRALMDASVDWAKEKGYHCMTLTTYTDVPFNGPMYRRYGFSSFAIDAQSWPELFAIRKHEAEIGLDVQPREAMILKWTMP